MIRMTLTTQEVMMIKGRLMVELSCGPSVYDKEQLSIMLGAYKKFCKAGYKEGGEQEFIAKITKMLEEL